MNVCLYVLAKFVPLFGGTLGVSELQQASTHSESILFNQDPLNLHVKQFYILTAGDRKEERKCSSEIEDSSDKQTLKTYLKDI